MLLSDIFYNVDIIVSECWMCMGILGVEMELVVLYMNVIYVGVEVLGVFIVSDYLIYEMLIIFEERECVFIDMIEIVLLLV